MKTNPIDNILPRTTDNNLKVILNDYVDLIQEIVNFGTHILNWDIQQNSAEKDNNIPSISFRNIIELADSISILFKSSSIDPSKIILRSIIENSYGLIYMIENNDNIRGKQFMIWKANKDIKYLNQFITTERSYKRFKSKLKKDSIDFNFANYFDNPEILQSKKTKEKLLEKSDFRDIQSEYIKTSKIIKNPNWYALFDGPRNFEELSIYLNKTLTYEFSYRNYSKNVHSEGMIKGFTYCGNGKAQVIQIRDFEDSHNVFVGTITILLELYNEFIRKRLPDNLQEFQDWFKDFREPFHNLRKNKPFRYEK